MIGRHDSSVEYVRSFLKSIEINSEYLTLSDSKSKKTFKKKQKKKHKNILKKNA